MSSVQLHYSSEYGSRSMGGVRLIELTEDMLESLLTDRESITFVGGPGDDVVAVTSDATYSVRIAETTNSLLMLPSPCWGGLPSAERVSPSDTATTRHITNTLFEYYELTQIPPCVHVLAELLGKSPFAGLEHEIPVGEPGAPTLYSTSQLRDTVQASDAQLLDALARMAAFEIDGAWRVLDPGYTATVLDLVLTVGDEHGWVPGVDAVVLDAVLDLAEGYAHAAVAHVVHIFTRPLTDADDAPHPTARTMDAAAVARFRGLEILRLSAADEWVLADFLAVWRDAVPFGLQEGVDLASLWGHVVVVAPGSSNGAVNALAPSGQSRIAVFPQHALSQDPRKRLQAMFKAQSHWTRPQLVPYLEPVTPPGSNIDAVLLKFARSSQPQGHSARVYSSRY